MARPRRHNPDSILDATLGLVLDRGAPTSTMAAIARASGAPIGSIYHSFGSREELLARLWTRAAKHSQAGFLEAAAGGSDPTTAALRAAMSVFDFARDQLADARLLASMRFEDLLGMPAAPALTAELQALNDPIKRSIADLAAELAGDRRARGREAVALATIDIPQGAIRRHLLAGRQPPSSLRAPLEQAVGAALGAIPKRGGASG
jgi:AcrR family transcriptional regulator